jgi:hypothetical protein
MNCNNIINDFVEIEAINKFHANSRIKITFFLTFIYRIS